MKRFLIAASVLALTASAAFAQDKLTMAVSIPAADHGWTGGVVFHAMNEAKALRSNIPASRSS